jgi:hypothetical protein
MAQFGIASTKAIKMRRPQFTLKTLLWLMAVVAAFFAGGRWAERRWETREMEMFDAMKRAANAQQKAEEELLDAIYGKLAKNPFMVEEGERPWPQR